MDCGADLMCVIWIVEYSVQVNSIEGDVLQQWPHRQCGSFEDIIFPNLQQSAALAQAPYTGLNRKKKARYSKHSRQQAYIEVCELGQTWNTSALSLPSIRQLQMDQRYTSSGPISDLSSTGELIAKHGLM